MKQAEILFNDQFVFLYVLFLVSTIFLMLEDNIRKLPHYKLKIFIVLLFTTLYTFLFGLRNFNVGTDTPIYLQLFGSNREIHKDVGFKILTEFLKGLTNYRGFLFIIALIYMVTLTIFIRTWNRKIFFYIFFMFISLFIFKNMGMNVIRQGLACTFCLLGLSMDKNRRYILAIPFLIISASMQITCIIPMFVWYVSKFISVRNSIAILCICSVFSILGLGIDKVAGFLPFLSGMFENRFDTYIDGTHNVEYITGFRASFFAFNWLFVSIGLFIHRKLYTDELQMRILKVFAILSGIFFLYFNMQYSDRIGLLSWMFIPLIFVPIFEIKTINIKYKIATIILFVAVFGYFILFPSK